uniref:RING-type domain-containing protein n=1 Tax=Wuchereria bancrofti TaxID=6293 RepID=A0A1I8EY65_WUCBA
MDVGEAVETFSVRPRIVFLHCMEVALRLPGIFLFELWWRSRDMHFSTDLFKQSFSSYLEMDQIIEFIQTRDFDRTGAQILSYTVVLISFMFFLLPLYKLVQVYFHILSLLLFSVAHYLSSRYVQLEQNGDPDLKLDDFTKLERHGFHILAQIFGALCNSNLENDIARVTLAVFLIPIIARTCAVPIDRLIIAHNVACSLAVLVICIYVLNKAPVLLLSIRHFVRYLKAIIILRGIGGGAAILWYRLRLAEILISAWLIMFFVRVYIHLAGKGRGFGEIGAIFLASVAESTNTPLSLLALALTVSCFCKQILTIAECIVGRQRGHRHVLANGAYTGALTLTLLCAQTGILGMRTEQKAFLLGLVLFIVVSALLQSLYEILEPQLLALAANRSTSRGQHVRSVFLAIIVLVASLCASIAVSSNCLLTAIHTLSTIIVYAIYRLETESMDTWGQADYVVFVCKTITCGVEVLLALNVVCFGILTSLKGHWTLTSLAVLVFYMYFSIWRQLQTGIVRVQSRRAAYSSLSRLPRVSNEALQQRRDACAICLSDLLEDARITPCKHFFHSACLKKWLCVKQVCPLCYSDLCKCKIPEALEELFLDERRNINAPEEREDDNSESFGAGNPSENEYFSWDVLSGSGIYY